MTSSALSSKITWPVGLRIRPPVDPDSADVEVVDSVTGRRFRWSPEALARYILQEGHAPNTPADGYHKWHEFLESTQDRRRLLGGWRHWEERRWYPSHQYYVASRRWLFGDTVDPERSIRAATVERYLSLDGPPPEEQRLVGPRLSLGAPAAPGDQELVRLLVTRRTGRAYRTTPVPHECLSGLLWFGLADVRKRREATDPAEPLSYLESYGSAFDFYLCIYNVAGVDSGTYRYEIRTHELTSIRPGNHRRAMIDILQGMRSPASAAWTLGLVADFPRYQWRYRHEHGLRRLYLEAGVLAQELLILGMSYGLSTLVTPAQKDRPYLELHDLSAERFGPIYTLTMGASLGESGVDFNGESLRQHGADRL